MNALMTYVEAHPWWTLVYLSVIASSFNGLVRIHWNHRKTCPAHKKETDA